MTTETIASDISVLGKELDEVTETLIKLNQRRIVIIEAITAAHSVAAAILQTHTGIVASTPIETLVADEHLVKALRAGNVSFVEDLRIRTEQEIAKIPNVSQPHITGLKKLLAARGLAFKSVPCATQHNVTQ